MSTEIGQLKNLQAALARETRERDRASRIGDESRETRATNTPGRGDADTVELSGSALRIQEAEQGLAELPEVDQARVAAVREALSNGAYQIDAGRLADRLIAQETLLASGGRS